ncbi:protein PELPK1-like [Brachypodium distachyon]|uniref:Uncharacterized protein n=1 Tax=Brachypodium distachyon TaxID=15368 RepID=I1GSM8_BRADI|nr:protein PELPK1-like [Brachypodium distachyon]PNT74811.1 hypothetical protein BRADI_1g22321v3 [Brachypodium distachyon]|eukprot:XP_003559995.1 protein PELPK1-like [Brachypodium distachyon]
MAPRNNVIFLLGLLLSCVATSGASRILEEEAIKEAEHTPHLTVPELPSLPKVEQPPFPEVHLPAKPELPPFPEVHLPAKPELPKVDLPPFPEVHLPAKPELPKVELPPKPEMPEFHFPVPEAKP